MSVTICYCTVAGRSNRNIWPVALLTHGTLLSHVDTQLINTLSNMERKRAYRGPCSLCCIDGEHADVGSTVHDNAAFCDLDAMLRVDLLLKDFSVQEVYV